MRPNTVPATLHVQLPTGGVFSEPSVLRAEVMGTHVRLLRMTAPFHRWDELTPEAAEELARFLLESVRMARANVAARTDVTETSLRAEQWRADSAAGLHPAGCFCYACVERRRLSAIVGKYACVECRAKAETEVKSEATGSKPCDHQTGENPELCVICGGIVRSVEEPAASKDRCQRCRGPIPPEVCNAHDDLKSFCGIRCAMMWDEDTVAVAFLRNRKVTGMTLDEAEATQRVCDEVDRLRTLLSQSVGPSSSKGPSPSKTETYKLRAECWHDVLELLKHVPAAATLGSLDGGEWEVTLRSPRRDLHGDVLSLEDLRRLIRERIEDGHVMVETLQSEATYTGEREIQSKAIPPRQRPQF